RLLDRRAGAVVGPVELVEVDPLHAEAPQAVLAFLADRRRSQVVADADGAPPPLPAAAALREDVDVLAGPEARERLADDLLGVAEPVDRRGVDPVHAALERVADCGDRLSLV